MPIGESLKMKSDTNSIFASEDVLISLKAPGIATNRVSAGVSFRDGVLFANISNSAFVKGVS
jgi:hypothetical protein